MGSFFHNSELSKIKIFGIQQRLCSKLSRAGSLLTVHILDDVFNLCVQFFGALDRLIKVVV